MPDTRPSISWWRLGFIDISKWNWKPESNRLCNLLIFFYTGPRYKPFTPVIQHIPLFKPSVWPIRPWSCFTIEIKRIGFYYNGSYCRDTTNYSRVTVNFIPKDCFGIWYSFLYSAVYIYRYIEFIWSMGWQWGWVFGVCQPFTSFSRKNNPKATHYTQQPPISITRAKLMSSAYRREKSMFSTSLDSSSMLTKVCHLSR